MHTIMHFMMRLSELPTKYNFFNEIIDIVDLNSNLKVSMKS